MITTKDKDGNRNGFLLPLWNKLEHDWAPEQVYLTTVFPGSSKGPHLHKVRHGRFVCVKGNVVILKRDPDGEYKTEFSGDGFDHQMVDVPPGTAAEISNNGTETAYVLNFVNPPWSAKEPDDWPVEDW